MTISLTPRQETLIQQEVDAGLYNDATDAVDIALQLLDNRDRVDCLKSALAIGEEQVQRGEARRWTPELMDQLIRESEQMVRDGIEPDPAVCP